MGRLVLVARGAAFDAISANGLVLAPAANPSSREIVPVDVVRAVAEAPAADVVVLAVKTFDLEDVAARTRARYGDGPPRANTDASRTSGSQRTSR